MMLLQPGGEAWNRFYCESFGIKEDKLLNVGLPRADYLINEEENIKEEIYRVYPDFLDKKIILYAPTFRRTNTDKCEELIKNINSDEYILIIKGHPNQELKYDSKGVYECEKFGTMQLLTVCDYLITDYSAIALEAAVLNKKTYYYLHDVYAYLHH